MDLEQQLSRVDLNLLVSLQVLLAEENVSRAADRLFLSQSAMSRTLQRLRDLFDDPLFVRHAKGITPTPKAQQLAEKLNVLLPNIAEVLHAQAFEPQQSEAAFNIAVPALLSESILLPLIEQLASQAPHMCINEIPIDNAPWKQLAEGKLDFAVHIDVPDDDDFVATPITSIAPFIYAHQSHPLAGQEKVSLTDCLAWPFVEMLVTGNQGVTQNLPLKQLFSQTKQQPKVIARSKQLNTLLTAVASRNALIVASNLLQSKHVPLRPIYQFDLPQKIL